VAKPVRVRRLTDQEGQRLRQIVRRGSTSSVRHRRAVMLPASAGGNRVPVIAQLVQADEDTVRDVTHRWAKKRKVESCFTPTYTSCANPRQTAGERLAHLHFSYRPAWSRRYDVVGNGVSGHGGRG